MRKPFMPLLAVAVALGIVLGGAFSTGVALGKSKGEETTFTQERGLFRQQSQVQFGQGNLTGVIDEIEGNTVTINTVQGAQSATLEVDTTIGRLTEGAAEDLQAGMQIMVIGRRGQDGTIIARSVLLSPQDTFGFFDRGLSSEDIRQPLQTPEGSVEGSQDHGPSGGSDNNFFFGGGQGHGPTSRRDGSGSGSGQHSP